MWTMKKEKWGSEAIVFVTYNNNRSPLSSDQIAVCEQAIAQALRAEKVDDATVYALQAQARKTLLGLTQGALVYAINLAFRRLKNGGWRLEVRGLRHG